VGRDAQEGITRFLRRPIDGLCGNTLNLFREFCLARQLLGPCAAAFFGGSTAEFLEISLMERAMNWDRMQGNWKQVSGKVKQQWGKLTDDALTQINGQRDQLVGKIQEAYGINRDEAEKQVKDWERLN